jgi:diacylglycerol O-acyltransferase
MQRLSAQDVSFFHIEDAGYPMHIGSVSVFEGPPPEFADVLRMFESKLPRVPRYRQRVRTVPLTMNRPVWRDDPYFQLEYHLRHTGLPSPGGQEQLRRLVGRVMGQQLDRQRPLWETWVVEGLTGGRWALISKVHHALVDGVGGSELLSLVLDDHPRTPPPRPRPWQPDPEPGGWALAAEAVTDVVGGAFRGLVGAARATVGDPRGSAFRLAATVRGMATLPHLAVPKQASALNGPIGPHRRWVTASASLDDIKRIRKAHGGTVNDVVLAAATQGMRRFLDYRGEPVSGRTVRAMIPVSVRGDAADRTGNRVAAIFAELPVGLDDPVERLHALTAQLQELKSSAQALAADALVGLAGFAPPAILAAAVRPVFAYPQRYLNTIVTNVPGPQRPLYALGRRMVACYPFVPIASTLRITTAVFSYDGTVYFGVTGDFGTVPDLDVVGQGVEEGFAALLRVS